MNTNMVGINYVEFHVGNLFQASHFYKNSMGFTPTAQIKPENTTRDQASILLKQQDVNLTLTSVLNTNSLVAKHVHDHGDGVKNIAFRTQNVKQAYEEAIEKGARSILESTLIMDETCKILKATVATFGDTHHSFIEQLNKNEIFLPHFEPIAHLAETSGVGLLAIDHFTVCLEEGSLTFWKNFYKNVFGFYESHRESINTKNSGMNSIVVQNTSGSCIFTLVEPAPGIKKSQIAEFLENYGSAGIQHIAFLSDHIKDTVRSLRKNGIQFLSIPNAYYEGLTNRNIDSSVLNEEIELLRHVNKLRQIYKHRRDVMLQAICQYFPKEVVISEVKHGFFIWVELPKTINTLTLFNKALEENIAFMPGQVFSYDLELNMHNGIRLNFSLSEPDIIKSGIKKLGRLVNHELKIATHSLQTA